MSKRLVTTVGLILAAFFIAGIIMLFIGGQDTAKAQPTERQQTTVDSDIYIVKDYNGKVAVFYEGEDKPMRLTEQQVEALPQTDRDMLKEGVTVEGKEALRRLLEDYTG